MACHSKYRRHIFLGTFNLPCYAIGMALSTSLVGMTFGRLTVVERAPERIGVKVGWKCVCICGKSTISSTTNLTGGFSTSCGCRRAESNRARAALRLPGKPRSDYEREYYARNREKLLAKNKAYRATLDPSKERERLRKWNASHPEQRRVSQFKARCRVLFGIEPEEYSERLAKQGNACAICNCEFTSGGKRRKALDHNHATGAIRDFLCLSCNTALGFFSDSRDLLLRAAAYLEKHATVPHGD